MKAHVLLSRPEDLEMAIEAAVLKEAVGKFECRSDQIVLDKNALLKLLSDKGETGTPTVSVVTNEQGNRYKDDLSTDLLGAIRNMELTLAAKKSKEMEVLEKLSLEVSKLGKRNLGSTGENLQAGTDGNKELFRTLQEQIRKLGEAQDVGRNSTPHSNSTNMDGSQDLMYELRTILAQLKKWAPGMASPAQNNNCFNCGKPGHYSRDCRLPRTGTNGTQVNRGGGSGRNENRNWNGNDNRYGPQQGNSNQRRYQQQNKYYEREDNRRNGQTWSNEQGNALQTARQGTADNGNPRIYTHVVAVGCEDRRKEERSEINNDEKVQVPVLNVSTEKGMVIHGMVNGHKGVILIDSGAQVSCIRKEFWEKVKKDTDSLLPSPHKAVLTVSGTESRIFGEVSTTLIIAGNSFELYAQVLELSQQDIILGRDFLLYTGAIVDFGTESVTFRNGGAIMAVMDISEGTREIDEQEMAGRNKQRSKARLHEAVLLGENTETVVLLYLDMDELGFEFLLEELESFYNKYGVRMFPTMVNGHTGLVPVVLANLTGVQVALQKDVAVAKITSLEDTMSTAGGVEVQPLEVGVRQDEEFLPIEHDLTGCDLDEDDKEKLKQLLISHRDIFAANSREMGETNLITHEIHLKSTTPIKSRPYRTCQANREKLRGYINEMLRDGVIEESSSAWSSPIVLVKKKDNTDRFCVDFRKLNTITEPDRYCLPRIDDVLQSLAGAKYFSTVDLQSGFWQIPMAETSKHLTTFCSYEGLYQFRKLPFGLSNGPASCQRMMEQLLRGLLWETCIVYLDDVIIFSSTLDQHFSRLQEVFLRLRDAGLKLKPSKCVFLKKQISFLGHVVDDRGVSTDPKKIELVQSFPVPASVKELRSILGLAGYYRKYVRDFARMVLPLNKLLKKGVKFVWSDECQGAFETLKVALTTAPILVYPDLKKEFQLFTDASDGAVGMILAQFEGKKEGVIAYAGRALRDREKVYSVSEKELLAVVEGVKYFEHYLAGKKFTIHTDHEPLKWLLKQKEPRGRLGRWSLQLQCFEYEVVHRPGKQHSNVDAISRIPYPPVLSYDFPGYIPQEIKTKQREDKELKTLVEYLDTGNVILPDDRLLKKADDFYLDDNGILHRVETKGVNQWELVEQLVIPVSLRQEVLINCHDHGLSAHFGTQRTFNKIQLRYWWPSMFSHIKEWCESCEKCGETKRAPGKSKVPLVNIPIGLTWDTIAFDFVGPLPVTEKGNKYVLVYVDYRSKWIEADPLPSMDSASVARSFFETIVCRFGCPSRLISDRQPSFLSGMMKEVYEIMRVEKVTSSAYHPQTDGQCERSIGTLMQALSMHCNQFGTDWEKYLKGVCFGYNTSRAASTGMTPFSMMFGHEPRLPLDVSLLPPSKLTADASRYKSIMVKNLEAAQRIAAENNAIAQEKAKFYYDRNTAEKCFQVGDKVWLHDPVVKRGHCKKLKANFKGPFEISEIVSDVNVRLGGIKHGNMHEIVHINRLKRYKDPRDSQIRNEELGEEVVSRDTVAAETKACTPPTGLEGATGAEEQEMQITESPDDDLRTTVTSNNGVGNVDHTIGHTKGVILDHRRRRQRVEYLVQKEGESLASAVWWKTGDLEGNPMVTDYLQNGVKRPLTRSRKVAINTFRVMPHTNLPLGELIFRMWLILILAYVGVASLWLGNVFNCDVTTYLGIYAIPDGLECPRNFLGANVTTYQADVKHHQARVTSLPIYLCTAEKVFKKCSENFLGIKDRALKTQPIRVSKGECKRVVKTRVTPYGKLYRHGYNTWINGERAYVCKWLKTDTISYVTFKMVRYEAYVQGSDFGLYQSITSSKCDSRAYFCRPQEIPQGILVWAKFNHSFETFQSLGLYQVHRVKEFIVIPALSVGGTILKEVSDRVLTDTGYVIVQLDKKGEKERDPKGNTDKMQQADALQREKMLQFRNVSREYVVKTKDSYRQDIAEGKISLALIREHQLVTNMATTICRTNKELRQVQRWILSSFPEEAASYIFPEKGYLIEHVGVGLLIHKCQELSVYRVHWDLKHGNFCYNTFPVTLPGETKPYFLNLHTMRIFTEGSKINCSRVQKLWYLMDGGQKLWELKLPNSFRQVKDRYFHQFRSNVALPKVFHFDTRLLHYNQKQQGRISLMRLLAMNKDNLDDLTQFRSVGGGDILGGITKLIGGTLSGIAKGGSTLLKALGSALEHGLNGVGVLEKDIVTGVGNASAQIITATGTGLSEILGKIGGIGSFLLWLVNFAIVGYLVWVRYRGRELEDLRLPQERREAPVVPPHVRPGGNACRATIC